MLYFILLTLRYEETGAKDKCDAKVLAQYDSHHVVVSIFFLILARERFSVQNVLDCTYDANMTHTKNFRFFDCKIDTKPVGELSSCARIDWLIWYYDFRK